MSEPCHPQTDRRSPPPRPASVTLSPLRASCDLHPNQAVVLDEVGEGEMVENKLVIPDEMVRYLSQVAAWPDQKAPPPTPPEVAPSSPPGFSNFNQAMSPTSNVVLSPGSNLNHIVSPSSNLNPILSPSSNLNQIMSPNSNMNRIMSPSSAINQMMMSPGSNVNQVMSPSSNVNQILSPNSNMNQIMSPSSNMNQMMSPNSNINQMMSPNCNINHQIMSPNSNMSQMMSPMSNVPQMMAPVQNLPQNLQNAPNYHHHHQMMTNYPQMGPARCHPQTMSSINNNHPQHLPRHSPSCNNQMAPGCYPNWNNGTDSPCNYGNNQCRQQAGGYGAQCPSHGYQPCAPNYPNGCLRNGYGCGGYGYGVSEQPMASPAMGAPAPADPANQPQQAQMTRPPRAPYYPQFPNQSCVQSTNGCANCGKSNFGKSNNMNVGGEIQCRDVSSQSGVAGMRQDAYQRTLEYVQNCQSWVGNGGDAAVTSSTHPPDGASNMVVNDMTSSLSSLLEENRYLQMIQ